MYLEASAWQPIEILLVEDNPGDVELTREALHAPNRECPARGGRRRRGRRFSFPQGKVRRRAAARHHPVGSQPAEEGRPAGAGGDQGRPALAEIPVVVLTTSEADEDILRAYQLHANCYITKPVDFPRFLHVVQSIESFWLTVVRLPRKQTRAENCGGDTSCGIEPCRTCPPKPTDWPICRRSSTR